MRKLQVSRVVLYTDKNTQIEMAAITVNGGAVMFTQKAYLVKKCANLGLALSDFLGSPDGYQLVGSELTLREKGKSYTYTDKEGNTQQTDVYTQNVWNGSFDLAATAETRIFSSAASKLAERMEAKFANILSFDLNEDEAEEEVEETPTAEVVEDALEA